MKRRFKTRMSELNQRGAKRAPQTMEAPKTFWQGHPPETRAVLERILLRAANNDPTISVAERILVNACELRCDLEAGGWHTRMQAESIPKLEFTRFLLQALGAHALADNMEKTIAALNAGATLQSKTAYLRHTERQLVGAGTELDQLLASFATLVGSGRIKESGAVDMA